MLQPMFQVQLVKKNGRSSSPNVLGTASPYETAPPIVRDEGLEAEAPMSARERIPDPRNQEPRARHRRRDDRRRCLARGRARASSSASSARTAPARRRSSTCSPACTGRRAAASSSTASTSPTRAAVPPHAGRSRPDVPGLERLPAALGARERPARGRGGDSAGRCASGGGRPRCARRSSAARWALGRVGLGRHARPRRPALLSHGDKRKLELAMLLAARPARDPARRADGRRVDRGRAGARRADPVGARRRGQDGADGRAPHGGRHRPRRADRRHAPRPPARLDTPDGDHGQRDRAGRRTSGSSSVSALLAVARPACLPRRVARAAGDLVRRRGGRRDRAARPQRRRQDDDAAGDDGPGRPPRARSSSPATTSSSVPTHQIVRRGVGYVPEDRDVFAGLTVDENLRLAERDAEPRYDLVYDLFPELRERGKQARRHALGRAAADARDRPRAAERQPRAARRRADEGPRALLVTEVARVLERVAELDDGPARRAEPRRRAAGVARDAVVLDTGRVVHIGPAAGAARTTSRSSPSLARGSRMRRTPRACGRTEDA